MRERNKEGGRERREEEEGEKGMGEGEREAERSVDKEGARKEQR